MCHYFKEQYYYMIIFCFLIVLRHNCGGSEGKLTVFHKTETLSSPD